MGQNPNRTPSEHPNPTTNIGSKMGDAPKTPKWDPIGFDHHSHLAFPRPPTRPRLRSRPSGGSLALRMAGVKKGSTQSCAVRKGGVEKENPPLENVGLPFEKEDSRLTWRRRFEHEEYEQSCKAAGVITKIPIQQSVPNGLCAYPDTIGHHLLQGSLSLMRSYSFPPNYPGYACGHRALSLP